MILLKKFNLSNLIGDNTYAVVLAHLSEINNKEELALQEFNEKENNHSIEKISKVRIWSSK